MKILGIESTAHTFGAGIVTHKAEILANVRDPFSTKKGGMIPWELMDHHVACCDKVLANALKQAKVTLGDIDIIAYSHGPGIGHALRVGLVSAKTLAKHLGIALVGVNHCVAHLEIGKVLTHARNPVMLYISGTNTQVIAQEHGAYRIFGETLDQGIGNMLDSFARHAGLGFPGGPLLYAQSLKSHQFMRLPYSVKGMDVAFGGLLTHVKRLHDQKKYSLPALAYSLQEHAFAMVLEVAERALAHLGRKELLLAGGVACNLRLQEMARLLCNARGARLCIPPSSVLVDNGAMIAWTGYMQHKMMKHRTQDAMLKSAGISPYERADEA